MSPGAGIGLRAPHFAALAGRRAPIALLEFHAENGFAEGGPALAWLERMRALHPLSVHGVGLSIGSADALDETHLARLAALVRRIEPVLVSEHLSWTSVGGVHANELLPLPFTRAAARHVAARVEHVQDRLGRAILLENVASYVAFQASEMAEWEFVAEVSRRAGCGILLDVSNVHVNAVNHGFDPRDYLASLEAAAIGQYHLGGSTPVVGGLIDSHAARVAPAAWELFDAALARFGARPTVVEWDHDLPALEVLLDEAAHAQRCLERASAAALT